MALNRQEKGNEQAQDKVNGMGTPARIGKYEYNAAINDARVVKQELRDYLRRAIRACPDSPAIPILTEAILKASDLDDIINHLDEIGRNTKEI